MTIVSAPPFGLEAKLTYGAVTLNANKKTTTDCYMVTGISGLDDADVRVSAENLPNQHGEIPLPGFYGGRTIVINGYIRASTLYALRLQQLQLKQAFGTSLAEQQLLFDVSDTAQNVYIYCRKSQPIQIKEEQTTQYWYRRDFQITLRASDPRFLAYTASTVNSGLNPTTGSTFNAVSAGSFYAYPVVTVIGPFNSGLTLSNAATGEAFITQTAIGSSQTVTFDMRPGVRTAIDQTSANVYSYIAPTSNWLTLVGGSTNIITITCAGGTAASKVTFNWNDAWL